MNIGKLDRRITLQRPTAGAATGYEPAGTVWTDVGDTWAGIGYAQGQEQYLADEKTAVQRVTFTLRYRADVTPAWRVRYQGFTYLLDAVAEIGRRAGLTLSATRRGQESTV
jgi:SPP1 family predicted phage head-tail adaptor